MRPIARAGLACVAVLLAWPSSAHAQGREGFVRALVDVLNAVNQPDERPLLAALDALAIGLQEWDRDIARAEAGFARDVGAAPPPVASRMRATLGLLYLERGRAGDAVAQLEQALRVDGAPAELHLLHGWALRAAGRRGDAAAAFLRAFTVDPDDPATAYLAWHHARDARADRVALARVAAAVYAAEAAIIAGGSERQPFLVPALLDDSAASEPILPPARYAKGFALLQQGKYEEAVAALRAAAGGPHADTDDRDALARVQGLIADGALDQAAQALEVITARAAAAGQAQWQLGRLYQRLNREGDALARFARAAAMNPIAGAAPLHVIVGQLHENQFDPDAAVRAFQRAIDVDPNHAPAHRELAEALVGLDRLDEARVEFIVALWLDGRDAVGWSGLGQLHAAQDRLEPAVAAFERAVAIDARNREAHYGLARALTRLGRIDEGRRELEIYERLQAEAMAAERRRFEENLQRIEQLRGAAPEGVQR